MIINDKNIIFSLFTQTQLDSFNKEFIDENEQYGNFE